MLKAICMVAQLHSSSASDMHTWYFGFVTVEGSVGMVMKLKVTHFPQCCSFKYEEVSSVKYSWCGMIMTYLR